MPHSSRDTNHRARCWLVFCDLVAICMHLIEQYRHIFGVLKEAFVCLAPSYSAGKAEILPPAWTPIPSCYWGECPASFSVTGWIVSPAAYSGESVGKTDR